ncbi:cytochrome P450 9e2 isoform X2 [Hyalella azteca]|uniref:Cytochrome P450 9e2 isoform X1 n=2 Tax=Hyalella azteca TaxID=294128 RepID=A0A8B7PJ39_HYAAZ|nr:cytochrome P450 9e2 isoform X1 [Hyalella azteca]XP_018025502.1 cytochrome P450 9e2 isoform X2 [Hyalella azteca]
MTVSVCQIDMWWFVVTVLVVLLTALILHAWRKQHYWQRRGVPVLPYLPLVGHSMYNMNVLKPRHLWRDEEYLKSRGERYVGLYDYLTPSLSIQDPQLIVSICIKDFDHFVDRRNMDLTGTDSEVMNDILTNATGNHWKHIRNQLTPTFTSGKMKDMFHLVQEQSTTLMSSLRQRRDANFLVDVKESFNSFTMDVIACCAFGLETNTLRGENKEFIEKAANLSKLTFKAMVKFFSFLLFPKLVKFLRISLASPSLIYMEKVVRDTMAARTNGVRRGDFLDLLLDARESTKEHEGEVDPNGMKKGGLKDSTIVAQCILFILAGYDTTANTLCFAAALLARNPQCQARLRAEVAARIEGNEGGKLTYQDVMECKYLDAVLSETLRMYPPAHLLERKCTKDYSVPDSDVKITQGMFVTVPVYSLHRDERYFPDPDTFLPDRFMPATKNDIPSGVYLPFGAGPRMCIAERFARMEARLALADLIMNFDLSVEPGSEELKVAKSFGILRPDPASLNLILRDAASSAAGATGAA